MKALGRSLIVQLILYCLVILSVGLLPQGWTETAVFTVIYKLLVFLPPILYYCKVSGYRPTDDIKPKFTFGSAVSYIFALSAAVTVINIFGIAASIALGNGSDAAAGFSDASVAVNGFISSVLLAPIFEETLFRGAVFHGSEGQNKIFRIALSAVLFALMHYSIERFFYALAAGFVISLFFVKYGLLFSMLLHAGANLVTWIFTVLRSFNYSEALVTAEYIFAAIFAVISVVGCVVWFIKHKKAPEGSDAGGFKIEREIVLYAVFSVILTVVLLF